MGVTTDIVLSVALWALLLGTLYKVFIKVVPKAGVAFVTVAILLSAVYFDVVLFRVKYRLVEPEGTGAAAVERAPEGSAVKAASRKVPELYVTSSWMWERWWRRSSYYNHGVLIIPVICFLIYRKRKRLAAIPAEPNPAGLWPIGIGLGIRVAASIPQVWFPSGFSLPLVLWGLVLYFWGSRAARELLFPLAFLVAMIPVPLASIDKMAVAMRNLATTHTALLVDQIGGVVALQDATYIELMSGGRVESVQVGDVCSGLRSLIALLAFGAIFAYLVPRSRVGKSALFLASAPIAYVSNVVRIIVLALLALGFGADAISPRSLPAGVSGFGVFGWFLNQPAAGMDWAWHNTVHYGTGLVIFVCAFFALLGVDWVIARVERIAARRRARAGRETVMEPAASTAVAATAPVAVGSPSRHFIISVVVVGVSMCLVVFFAAGRPPELQAQYADRIPLDLGVWTGERRVVAADAKNILGTEDVISRAYSRGKSEPPVGLSVVYSESDRKVAHPPPVCYRGAGYMTEQRDSIGLPGGDGIGAQRPRVARAIMAGKGRRLLVVYWYKSGDVYTSNYIGAQLRQMLAKLFRRPGSIGLVQLTTLIEDGGVDAATQRILDFVVVLEPELGRYLP